MTITTIPCPPAHAVADRRLTSRSAAVTPIRTLRRRLATRLGDARHDRQPMVTLSEQAIANIHNVHSVHR